MTGRICYLERADRGARIVGIRLVGGHAEEAWTPHGARDADPGSPADDAAAAAAWVADRLAHAPGGPALSMLCLDADGATCSWLTAPSADPAVLAAAAAQRENGSPDAGAYASLSSPSNPVETSLQALAPADDGEPASLRRLLPARRADEPASSGRRLAVLAVPDVAARIFIDALDERGVTVNAVASLWHAMATAWDPAGPLAAAENHGGARADRIVATSSGVAAIVLIDPAGRLVWAWSRAGELLAGGTLRLLTSHTGADLRDGALARRAEDAPPPLPAIGPPDIARLTTDWLAWSAQLGCVPSRIVCLGPEAAPDPEALGPAELGAALGRAWDGATVDLAVHDDPVGATLARLARLPADPANFAADPQQGLIALSRRPGRAHRALHRWGAAAILAASLVLFVVAWKAWDHAESADARRADIERETTGLVAEVLPGNITPALAQRVLKDALDKLKSDRGDAGRRPAKPILAELETISVVLASMPGAHIEDLAIRDDSVLLRLTVPDTRTAELILESLGNIDGSRVDWKGSFDARPRASDRYAYTLQGAWRAPAGPAGSAPQPGPRAAGARS